MSEKKNTEAADKSTMPEMTKKEYKETLLELQVELTRLQRHYIEHNERILIIFEGRDAAGKDGTIKRIVQHLSPREVRVVALSKPSDRDRSQWYFQRYVAHLPAAQELVLFNRSWYNRAGVEKVMGFCTDAEYDEFMDSVPEFESMLVRSGIRFFKYYLDISKDEQKTRLHERKTNPLTQWKSGPLDDYAIRKWDQYSRCRNRMLAQTHHAVAPWTVVRADNKQLARINIIRDILSRIDYDNKDRKRTIPDQQIVMPFDSEQITNGVLSV